MNKNTIFLLKILRKIYTKFHNNEIKTLNREEDPNEVANMLYNLLSNDKPCMIARFGSTELSALVNYLGVNSKKHSVCDFIMGKQPEWWWNNNIMNQMKNWSGFFPATPSNLQKFGDMMIEDIKEIDILGSWLYEENYFERYYNKNIRKVNLLFLEPFWSTLPWTRVLKDKNVLVIHPFAETIEYQYNRRTLLFENKDVLPSFKLKTIKAVQSLGGNDKFNNWFDALDWMKNEMDKVEYDICLIGCGAYGFLLASHAKKKGKKAVHLGGALQLLFGIKGKRWENPNYGIKSLKRKGAYISLFNENWCYPNKNERPDNADNVENACYW